MTSWLFHCYNLAYEFQWRKWGWFWDECLQILYVCVTIISSDPIVQLSSTGFTNKYINRDNIKELSIYLIFILDVFFMFSNNSGGYLLYGQKKAVCEHWAQIPLSCENLILFFFLLKNIYLSERIFDMANAGMPAVSIQCHRTADENVVRVGLKRWCDGCSMKRKI